MTDTASVSVTAPAKINLALHVCGRRDDGYHLLDSLVVFCAVGDALTATPAPDLSLSIQGRAAAFISSIEGSHSGIMGLPLFETTALLRSFRGQQSNHAK